MERWKLGIAAAVLLSIAIWLSVTEQANQGVWSGFLRMGLVMSAAWLAFPQIIQRKNWKTLGLTLLAAFVLVLKLPPMVKLGLFIVVPLLLLFSLPQLRMLKSWLNS